MEQCIFLLNKILHNNHNVTALLEAGNNSANCSVCTKWYKFGLAAVVSPHRSRICDHKRLSVCQPFHDDMFFYAKNCISA